MASVLAHRTEYFSVLQSKNIYTHAPVLVSANNENEAAGKMLRMVEEKYPSSDGWDVQLSLVTEVKND